MRQRDQTRGTPYFRAIVQIVIRIQHAPEDEFGSEMTRNWVMIAAVTASAAVVASAAGPVAAADGHPDDASGRTDLSAPAESSGDALDPAAAHLAALYGVAPAEAVRRLELQEAAGRLQEELTAKHGSTFAGLWMDQERGQVVVASTDEGRSSLDSIGEVGIPDVEHVSARHSTKVLNALKQRAQRGLSGRQSLLHDVVANQLVLAVPPATQLSPEVQAVMESEPTAFRVWAGETNDQATACVKPYCDAPLRGGVATLINNTTIEGSTGFNVRSNSDGKSYVLVAGHTLDWFPSQTWNTRMTSGSGHGIGKRWNDLMPGFDAGIMTVDNVPGWLPGPRIVVWPGSGISLNENYGVTGQAVPVMNGVVCRSGISGSLCGTVKELSYDAEYASPTISNTKYMANGLVVVQMSPCSVKGDSGGPWWAGGKAYGIQSGNGSRSYGCVDYFTRVDTATSNLNVSLRTVANP